MLGVVGPWFGGPLVLSFYLAWLWGMVGLGSSRGKEERLRNGLGPRSCSGESKLVVSEGSIHGRGMASRVLANL